jgi:hypothetical protein
LSGEGSVYQRADGRWCAKYKEIRGRWRYLYRKTKADASTGAYTFFIAEDKGMIR